MKNSLGFCLMGLRVFSARGSRAPLLLDRGVVDAENGI